MKKFSKIRGLNAWYEVIARTLYVRWCCRTIIIRKGKNKGQKKKISKKIAVQTPQPDILYNNSIYTYLVNWVFTQNYEVYLLHGTELRRVGKNRFDDFRLMIDEILNDYFLSVSQMSKKCPYSPMAKFSLYDYGNSPKHKRRVVIIALDETDFTCTTIPMGRYFFKYFGNVYSF